jgi:hypothetical protein
MHEDEWGSGGKLPALGDVLRMLHSPVVLSPGTESPVLLNRTLSGTAGLEAVKSLCPCRELNHDPLALRNARSLVE